MKGVPTGLYYFGVRQIGYKPVAELLHYDQGDTLRVTLERVKAVVGAGADDCDRHALIATFVRISTLKKLG